MKKKYPHNSAIINGIAIFFTVMLFIFAIAGAHYTNEMGTLLKDWHRILIYPCPLVTDYFAIGSLGSAFLNAAACGAVCCFFMLTLPGESHGNTLAGYFLVIAHCFYGLNFLNMWPCFLAPFLYMKLNNLDYKQNLHAAMFTTCFAPFISEFLFRYSLGNNYSPGEVNITSGGVMSTIIFSFLLTFVVPALLPGARAWHKGYNLYNGGLAFGIFGFLLFNFMYKTLSSPVPQVIHRYNAVYESFGFSYRFFGNVFFFSVFSICFFAGFILNNHSLDGFRHLVRDTGHISNFADKYGMPLCLINIGLYGFVFLAYINLIIYFTVGAGFTGPTFGVILAALTFTAMGQHPANVWPIILGYQTLYVCSMIITAFTGRDLAWSVSTQAYINGVAFATGLSPIVGRYGRRAGVVAGFLCACMCSATKDLHGGLILYNGGFTAGLTAMILLPILEHYFPDGARNHMTQVLNMRDMMTMMGVRNTKKNS